MAPLLPTSIPPHLKKKKVYHFQFDVNLGINFTVFVTHLFQLHKMYIHACVCVCVCYFPLLNLAYGSSVAWYVQMPSHSIWWRVYQFFGICFVRSSIFSHILTVITDFLNSSNDRPLVWLVYIHYDAWTSSFWTVHVKIYLMNWISLNYCP